MNYALRLFPPKLPSHWIILFQTILSFFAPISLPTRPRFWTENTNSKPKWNGLLVRGFKLFVVRRRLHTTKPSTVADQGHFFYQSFYAITCIDYLSRNACPQAKRGLVSSMIQSLNLSTYDVASFM